MRKVKKKLPIDTKTYISKFFLLSLAFQLLYIFQTVNCTTYHRVKTSEIFNRPTTTAEQRALQQQQFVAHCCQDGATLERKKDCKKSNVCNKSKWHNINKSVVIKFYVLHVYIKYVRVFCLYYVLDNLRAAFKSGIVFFLSGPSMCLSFGFQCLSEWRREGEEAEKNVRHTWLPQKQVTKMDHKQV